ncbi:MAG TPA: GAF domain-containing protein, partial [Pyrinomonadaceae bacterium]|nr:GAF domain-containing protein [Pyrinomonadaceae bacterium]
MNELFKLIHESISKVLYAENCFIALHDSETDLMHFEFWADQHDPAPPPQPVGVGFGSYVLQSGKSILLTEELTAQMISAGLVKNSGTFSPSWLGVPLRTASRIIGVLAVQHYDSKDAYTETDLQFLDSVGSQIAMAIERKRIEQALFAANKRALADYESLVERIAALGRTLGTARELKMIFRALRDFAVASVPCEGLVISLYDHDKGSRRIVYGWTDDEELESSNGTEAPVRDSMVGRAIKSGAVVIENDYRASPADTKAIVAIGSRVDRAADRSALAAPMTVMGRTVGCVEVQCHRAGAFENGHATAMRMAANLAANAIENVVLIEREQEKEEQLRQAQKMESIGTLAGGIAHDFNNLMTAVTGYSDLALRGSLDDSLRGKIEQIKKAGERAATLTRQLLAFSRKQMLQPEVLDLNAVVNGLITMLPRLIGEHIEVNLKLSSSLGRIKADPGQIEQVLVNLAVNSRDAMPQGGCLMIETRNVHLSAPITKVGSTIEPGHYVLLSVSDNGGGMDAEIQAQIFEPFFTTKGVGKGTGLGLSTVYGIVKQSGGNVWVYSEPGKGTAFKIYLPRVDEVEEPEIALPAPAASRGKETILLVEDEEQVRNLSKEILEGYGYSVLAAPDGSAGLSLGQEFPGRIDLVLTDVIMPQMGGKELVDQLKSLRPDSKILFMSGFTDDAIIHHGVLDDGVFFLQKPFTTECLAAKVREVLD